MTNPQTALTYILKGILPEGEDVFNVQTDETGKLIIHCKKELIGQVIGKEGRIIKSIRLLLAAGFPDQLLNIEVAELQ